MTPENVSVLCEVLPRLTLKSATAGDTAVQMSFFGNEANGESAPTEKVDTPAKGKGKPASAPAKDTQKAAPAADDNTEANPSADPAPETPPTGEAPTKTDVRALALKLSKAGKQDVIKEIFGKYGADKLSGVAEEHYPELMKDLVAANAEV